MQNAYWQAEATGDLVVEGVLVICNDGERVSAVRHVWNKHEDTYYDVTNQTFWQTEEYRNQQVNSGLTGTVAYHYYRCSEYSHDKANFIQGRKGTWLSFRYSYRTVDFLK